MPPPNVARAAVPEGPAPSWSQDTGRQDRSTGARGRRLRRDNGDLRLDNQALKDEIARLDTAARGRPSNPAG